MFSNIVTFWFLVTLLPIISSFGSFYSSEESDDSDALKEAEKEHQKVLLEKLGELAITIPEASIIWDITNKYNILDDVNINKSCIDEMDKDRRLVPFYLVDLTLERCEQLFWRNRPSHYRKHKEDIELYYKNRIKVSSDQETYLSTVEKIIVDFSETDTEYKICVTESGCGCIFRSDIRSYKSAFTDFKGYNKRLWTYIIFKSYIETFFRGLVIIIGIILNCTLLTIFIREKSMRTESNLMIINLAFSNIIMLLLYIPSDYVKKYISNKEGFQFIAIEVLSLSLNSLLVLFFNIQRYFQVTKVLDNSQGCVSSRNCRIIIYTSVLWIWSLLISILLGIIPPFFGTILEIILFFFLYTIVFSIILSIFNSMTARKLHRAFKEGRSSSEFQNIIGSGVVLCLTISYYTCHMAFFIYKAVEIIIHIMSTSLYMEETVRVIVFLVHLLLFLYPCVNVMVLYKASAVYRNFINKYLLRFWYAPEEGKYVTMSSLSNTEREEQHTI